MISEFDLIRRYFNFSVADRPTSVSVGVGDDAALIHPSTASLLVATDTLIEGVHFPKGFPAAAVASRALGVNLSDFAAMAAQPKWLTMALSLPTVDDQWLQAFAEAFESLCRQYDLHLVGGDTTKGHLSISLTVMGEPYHLNASAQRSSGCLLRSAARPEQDLWVSGTLGKGAAALALLNASSDIDQALLSEDDRQWLLASFYSPQPRLALAAAIRDFATAAIDISDGLIADARHIANASNVLLNINSHQLPRASGLSACSSKALAMQWVLHGGDDYELLFTADKPHRDAIVRASKSVGIDCHRIGDVSVGQGVMLDGVDCLQQAAEGYRHF